MPMPPGPRAQRTVDILRLYELGRPQGEIARLAGCSVVNVHMTLKRHGRLPLHLPTLPMDKHRWLLNEARKAGVPPSEMARALLVDAIDEAMEERKTP